jgi:hypothetical protein
MRGLLLLTVLGCASAYGAAGPSPAGGSIFGSAPPVPDWVKTAAPGKLPVFTGAPKAVVLLDEMTYTVGVDGRAIEHERYV